MRRTLEETIARAEWLIGEDAIPREIVRDEKGDYWIVRAEASALLDTLDTLDEPVVVWSPKS